MYGGQQRCIQGFGGNTRGKKNHLENPGVRWEDNIKMELQEVRCGAWTRSIRLRIGTVRGHL